MLTVIGLDVGYLLGGSVVTETVFNWPGLGRARRQRDFPARQSGDYRDARIWSRALRARQLGRRHPLRGAQPADSLQLMHTFRSTSWFSNNRFLRAFFRHRLGLVGLDRSSAVRLCRRICPVARAV